MGHISAAGPLMALLPDEARVELPYAEVSVEPTMSPMLQAMLDEAEVDIPPGIADILDASPTSVAADVLETYRQGIEIDEVEIQENDSTTTIETADYTLTLQRRISFDADSFESQVLLRYILRQADLAFEGVEQPGAEAVIRICICGSTTCGIGPHSWVRVRLD